MLPAVFEVFPGGRRLRVARLGSGPPLVLLHGYPDNLQLWGELARRLADRFQVIAFDWPGMGYSDAWVGGTTPAHLAERLRTLLDTWGISRANVAGLDMGGQPALVFAASYPERVERLVVMNSLLFGEEQTSWEIRLMRRFGWNRFILRNFPGLVFRRAERTFLPRGVRLSAELRADLWESFRRPEVRHFISRMCAGYQGRLPELPALYARVRCPTLALWAGCDKHFPPVHAERLQAALPGSRLEIVAGAEHWMPWYLAEEVAGRLRAFLEGGGGVPAV
jgi:pimeloyl-ACP methyl ester carboxylesterase